MNSRERVIKTLNHEEPDRVPLDLGAGGTTGVQASLIYSLRRALGLKEKPIKVICCYQMLGEIDDELADILEIDTVKIVDYNNIFGFRNEGWKEWTLEYPQGDKSVPPSGKMPKGGFYFDAITRQHPIDDNNLNVEDNLEEFTPYSDEYLRYMEETTKAAYETTNKAILGAPGGTALGDIAFVPGVQLKDPKGIRAVEEWYVSVIMRKDYITEVFDRQTDIAIENLKRYYEAVGNKIVAIQLCGNDK